MKADHPAESRTLYLLRAFSVLMVVALSSVVVIYFNESGQLEEWSAGILATVTLIVAFNLACAWSYYASFREHSRHVLYALWTMVACNVVMHFSAASLETAGTFAAFTIARVPVFYRLRTGFYFIVGAVLLFATAMVVRNYSFEHLLFPLFALPVYLFVLAISYTFMRERNLRLQTHALMRELQTTQALLAQSSRQNERLRIAREMHDLLGHHMTALILNLEVAKHKITGNGLEQVEQSLALAKLLLSDLRTAVSELREGTSLDFNEAIRQVIDDMPELNVILDMNETFEISDPRVAEALLRCIQEALTNTLRHARATQCTVRLCHDGTSIVLDYEDNGSLQKEIVPGNGLNGMLERVKALSGKLDWGARNGRFYIHAVLPPEAVLL
jgi:signal transduction histidine kinase